MAPPWVDSHCHLEMLQGDIDMILSSALDDRIQFCVTIGTDYKSSLQVIDFCDTFSGVYGVVGIHPHNASGLKLEELTSLVSIAKEDPKIIAIGECGFDLFYTHSSIEEQKSAFVVQLEAAKTVNLPVVIHARDADREVRDVMGSYRRGDISGVFHSLTSSLDQARWILDMGFYISFNGICTFPNAGDVREVLKYTPLDRILLETDAPFLAPVPLRGKKNQPGNVSIVGEFVASFLELPVEELAETVYQNTVTLFNKIRA